MSASSFRTKVQVGELTLYTAPTNYTAFKVVLTPVQGTTTDEANSLFCSPLPVSKIVLHFNGLSSGAVGTALTQMQAAKASKLGIFMGLRNDVAEGSSNVEKLSIVTQPSTTASTNTAFAIQPVVQLVDQNGDNVHWAGVTVTASRTTGTDTLGGTLTADTDADGRAVFTDLKLTTAGGTHTDKLTFAATGRTSTVESGGIVVS